MKMVILGAGASYDSIILGNTPHLKDKIMWRPPLGKELFGFHEEFDEILKKYPGALSFRSEISLCSDIEELFQNKYELSLKPNGETLLFQIINVQFYLQELFYKISLQYVDFGTSNYDILVTQAYEHYLQTNEKVLFVTFNYDTLLERSIERRCNIKFGGMNDYINNPLIVIKPHGSCNWIKKVNNVEKNLIQDIKRNGGLSRFIYEPAHHSIARKLIESLDVNFSILPKSLEVIEKDPTINLLCLPQILIPLKTKDEFNMPDSHLQYLENHLSKINDILIIGWKANELHFQKLLTEKIKSESINVMYVCGSDTSLVSMLIGITKDVNFKRFSLSSRVEDSIYKLGTFSSFTLENNKTDEYRFFK